MQVANNAKQSHNHETKPNDTEHIGCGTGYDVTGSSLRINSFKREKNQNAEMLPSDSAGKLVARDG
jgi:hypothetical protein